MLIALIIAGLFVFAYIVHILKNGFIWCLVALIVVAAISIAIPWISAIIREHKAKKPKLTPKQQSALDEARKKDDEATARNTAARAAAEEKHNAAVKARTADLSHQRFSLLKDLEAHAKQLKKEFAALEAIDCVGEEEKNLQAVELLINFIKTRRADNIKEALHEYDKLIANQQLLEIENQKLEVQRQAAIQEHMDRQKQLEMQKQHNWEMELRAMSAAEQNSRIASQLDHIGYMIHAEANKPQKVEATIHLSDY